MRRCRAGQHDLVLVDGGWQAWCLGVNERTRVGAQRGSSSLGGGAGLRAMSVDVVLPSAPTARMSFLQFVLPRSSPRQPRAHVCCSPLFGLFSPHRAWSRLGDRFIDTTVPPMVADRSHSDGRLSWV